MGIYIPRMGDHWLKLLVCVLTLFNTKVNSQDNIQVDITLIADAVQKGAVCLDGSPAGYHLAPGFGDGVDNWLVYLPGGGWCNDKESCMERVKKSPSVSSTVNFTHTFYGGILSQNISNNPDFYNWNRVKLRYCDGASFMADVEEVDPESNLHLRGARNFRAVIDELLSIKGMKNAKKAVLVGNSAGGLATILHCDRFRQLVPDHTTLKCISDSGFFIHAKNLPNADGRVEVFSKLIEYHRLAESLPKSCTSKMDLSLCLFPENLVGDVKTPLFLVNSEFDQYQIQRTLKPYPGDEQGWASCTINSTQPCTHAQLELMREFRNTFLETLKGVSENPSRGLYINSCYVHDYIHTTARWDGEGSPKLANKTIREAIGDWYSDRCPVVRLIDTQTNYPLDCKLPPNFK